MEMSQHLKQTFEATIKVGLFPRSQIDIFVEVLQVLKLVISYDNLNLCMKADGGNYCACVNAATLALIDAGIPLVDYVSACTASLVSSINVKTCVATTSEIDMSFQVYMGEHIG